MKIQNLILVAAPVFLLQISNGFACSQCGCGDRTFLATENDMFRTNAPQSSRLRLVLQNHYSMKENALSEDEGPGTESEHEVRPSLRLDYQIIKHLALSAELPLSYKRLEVTTEDGKETEHTTGLSDASLAAIWSREFFGARVPVYRLGFALTIKAPTGHNNMQRDGERLEEHLQPGTGSYDWQVSGVAARSTAKLALYSSIYYRKNGTNQFDYHYGNSFLFNLGYSLRFSDWFTPSAQVNVRYARWDLENGERGENTGGWVIYLAPGMRVVMAKPVSLALSAQIPVHQSLYGVQTEKTVFNLTVNFER